MATPALRLQKLPADCLYLILQFETNLPYRFFEVWHALLPQLTRRIWNSTRWTRSWNENIPFPGIYRYFMLRIGCYRCGYLASAPTSGLCQSCDFKHVFYEQKSNLKKRFSLRKAEFAELTPPVVLEGAPQRSKFYLVREAISVILEGRYQGSWKDWYRALAYQEEINERRALLKKRRQERLKADMEVSRFCETSLETNTWNYLLRHWQPRPVHQPLTSADMHWLAERMQLREAERWIPAMPTPLGRFWAHVMCACKWKFALEYCTTLAPDPGQRIGMSTLGCLPHQWPWLCGITAEEWRQREMKVFQTQTRWEKLQVLMGLAQAPGQLPPPPSTALPSFLSSSTELLLLQMHAPRS